MTGGLTIILDRGDRARSAVVTDMTLSPRTHACDVHLSICEGARNACPVIGDHKVTGSAQPGGEMPEERFERLGCVGRRWLKPAHSEAEAAFLSVQEGGRSDGSSGRSATLPLGGRSAVFAAMTVRKPVTLRAFGANMRL